MPEDNSYTQKGTQLYICMYLVKTHLNLRISLIMTSAVPLGNN